MITEKVQGIVLKLIDYKEADKLASIFTLEQGIITAKFTGVKKEKAKLKAIAQSFVFAEFNLASKGNLKQVINATLIDNFYPILSDYNKTICAYIVLDIINTILPQNKAENELFVLTLNTLKNIEKQNEFVATIDYILKFFEFSGIGVELPDTEYVFFNKFTGEFEKTSTANSVQIDKKNYQILKEINKSSNDYMQNKTNENDSNENKSNQDEKYKQILRLLHNIIFIKFNEEIKSFSFI